VAQVTVERNLEGNIPAILGNPGRLQTGFPETCS